MGAAEEKRKEAEHVERGQNAISGHPSNSSVMGWTAPLSTPKLTCLKP